MFSHLHASFPPLFPHVVSAHQVCSTHNHATCNSLPKYPASESSDWTAELWNLTDHKRFWHSCYVFTLILSQSYYRKFMLNTLYYVSNLNKAFFWSYFSGSDLTTQEHYLINYTGETDSQRNRTLQSHCKEIWCWLMCIDEVTPTLEIFLQEGEGRLYPSFPSASPYF